VSRRGQNRTTTEQSLTVFESRIVVTNNAYPSYPPPFDFKHFPAIVGHGRLGFRLKGLRAPYAHSYT
jgi:hypothetical protein